MSKISKIISRQVFDSRGYPTIESEVFLKDGSKGTAIVPSGASTGSHEAFELRDVENKKYLGKSVLQAMEKVNGEINKALKGFSANEQKKIDDALINLVRKGEITSDDALRYSIDQKAIKSQLDILSRQPNL